ncbi:unnamed protein product [Dibothriocephalus latus]|uniref:Uncharacterized protein n=1 Tax=Dibothriocephalus latus TaxID=60516 RepID=A0A3P7RD30_DIBLA|nr:unnamed protein product [Dibothriocephalus latus]
MTYKRPITTATKQNDSINKIQKQTLPQTLADEEEGSVAFDASLTAAEDSAACKDSLDVSTGLCELDVSHDVEDSPGDSEVILYGKSGTVVRFDRDKGSKAFEELTNGAKDSPDI